MEFLRFGSSIPGAYWGCCACCIIQDFNCDPDAKNSIEVVCGDGGQPLIGRDGGSKFLGLTNREIFLARLRIGTFSDEDMPNHAFFAILTDWQLASACGKKWLAILKEQGFEFIRTVSNSVYTGPQVIGKAGQFGEVIDPDDEDYDEDDGSAKPNYIFGLVRNIGQGCIPDPIYPPLAWMDLPSVVPELYNSLSGGFQPDAFVKEQQEAQLKLWNALPPVKFYTEAELVAAGVPVVLAGRRSDKPQELKSARESKNGQRSKTTTQVAKTSPFGASPVKISPSY